MAGTTNSDTNNLVRLNNGSASVGFIRKTAAAWQINLREDAHPTTEHREYVKSQHLTARDTNVRNYIAPGRNIMGWVIDETAEEAGRTLQSRRLNIMFRFLYHTNGSFNRTLNFTIQNNIVTTNWVNTPSGVFIDPDTNLPYTLQHRFRRETSGARRAIIEFRWNPTGNLGANFYPELIADHLYQYNTYSVASNVPARDVWTNIVDLNGNVAPAGESWLTFALRPLFDGHDSVVPIIVNNAGAANETTIQCNDLNLLNWNDLPNYLNQVEVRRSVDQIGHAVTDHGLRHTDLVTFSNAAHRAIKWLSGLATQHGSGDIYDYDKGANFRGDLTQNGSQVALQSELPADNELIPDGGNTNQVLAKRSNTDHDTYWKDDTGGAGISTFPSILNAEPMRLLTQNFTYRAGNLSTTGAQPIGYQIPAAGDGVVVISQSNSLASSYWLDMAELRGLTESVAGTNLANVPVGQRKALARDIAGSQEISYLIGRDANFNLLIQATLNDQGNVVNAPHNSFIIRHLTATGDTFKIEDAPRVRTPAGNFQGVFSDSGYDLNDLGDGLIVIEGVDAGPNNVFHISELRALVEVTSNATPSSANSLRGAIRIPRSPIGYNSFGYYMGVTNGRVQVREIGGGNPFITKFTIKKLVATNSNKIPRLFNINSGTFTFDASTDPVLVRVGAVSRAPATYIDEAEIDATNRVITRVAGSNPVQFSANGNVVRLYVANTELASGRLVANWSLIQTDVFIQSVTSSNWRALGFQLPAGDNEFILHSKRLGSETITIGRPFSASQLRAGNELTIFATTRIRLAADGTTIEIANVSSNTLLELFIKEVIST